MAQKILIAEDEEVLLGVLRRKLEMIGYEVITAKDGLAALNILKRETPDLLLLDVMMPKMDGFELLEKLKQRDPDFADKVPIIIISNSGQPVEIKRGKDLGARDFIIKTDFDPAEVVARVEKVLGPPKE